MKTRTKKSRSIARQLNAELEWRRFFRNLLLTTAAAFLAVGLWCYIREGMAGGRTFGVVSRSFSGSLRPNPPADWGRALRAFPGDFGEAFRRIVYGAVPQYSEFFPFRGIEYRFSMPGDPGAAQTAVSAETVLGVTWWSWLAVNLSGLLSALVHIAAGSGLIRKYLRPLDEMADLAERLSEERHTADRESVRAETAEKAVRAGKSNAAGEGGESGFDLDRVIDEIDDVEDSGEKLEFHEEELEGLESALNNMLRRLEDGKKKQIRFVDDASHELRTPIAVIHGYADMLDRWGKNDPKVLDEAVGAIKVESEHMTTLIDQLLFLARGEMDRHVLDRQPIDAQALLDEIMVESEMLESEEDPASRHVFRMLSHPAEAFDEVGDGPDGSNGPDSPEGSEQAERDPESEAAPDGQKRADPSALTVYGDPAMIKQSVRILRDNAVKYTPAGGEVTFKAYARDRAADGGRQAQVCFEVGDNGIGIPSDELPRIFDRFYRGSNARADNAGGSGLGLSIAQWIVREHGGTIEAISGSGFGTRMTIVLPRYEEKG